MQTIISWIETWHAQLLAGGFLLLQGMLLVLLLVAVRQIGSVKRQIQKITAQVEHYMKVVLDTEECKEGEPVEARRRTHREEEENRLISAVLKEIFP